MSGRAKMLGLGVVVLILLGAAFCLLHSPTTPPAGQPPLARLSAESLEGFAAAFDAGASAPRLVLLLSPT